MKVASAIGKIEQDYLRRIVLKEHDVPGAATIELLSHTARFALDRGWNVALEGILLAERYTDMLAQLHHDHAGTTAFYYFDVPWHETLRRHQTRPQAAEFGTDEMQTWYRPHDQLGLAEERIIPEDSTLDATMHRILAETFHDTTHSEIASS